MLLALVGLVSLLCLGKVLWALARAQQLYSHVPGYFGIAWWKWSLLLPKHKRWGFFDECVVLDQGRAYKELKSTGYLIRSLWEGNSTLILSDPEGVKQVTGSPNLWVKPDMFCEVFGHFGPSLLITEGDEYKRHRKAAGPAFGEGFTRGMWDAALTFVDQFVERLPAPDARGQQVGEMAEASRQITLMVIAQAGFGITSDWPEEGAKMGSKGHLELIDTLRETIKFLIVKSLGPKWMWSLPVPTLQRVDTMYATFEAQVLDLMDRRREEEEQGIERHDLLSRLISASDSQSTKDKLTNQELLSNVHIFMAAGHETTAHAVSVALMFLAMYPEQQDAVAAEARRVFGAEPGGRPGYDRFSELKLTTAAFLETLRLYPRLPTVSKTATADTTVTTHTVPTKLGEAPVPVPIALAKGTYLIIDIPGMGQNAQYWGADAASFRPSRFVDTDEYRWPRDAFLPFSGGLRGCIGKQAALVEGTAVLARLLSQFRVEPPAAEAGKWKLREGETEFERRERIYEYRNELLVGARPLNIAFVPRE